MAACVDLNEVKVKALRKNILICGTWRSGTTMVCEDMKNTEALGYPREYFPRWEKSQCKDWKREFEEIRAKSTSGNGVFSTKLMAKALPEIEACFSTFVNPSSGGFFPHINSAFGDPLWVWVRRKDKLLQAISSYSAQETKVYHLTSSRSGHAVGEHASLATPKPAEYNFSKISRRLSILQRHDFLWQSFFEVNGINPLVIWYEDAATRSSIAPLISEAAGISILKGGAERTLKKLGNDHSMRLKSMFLDDLQKSLYQKE